MPAKSFSPGPSVSMIEGTPTDCASANWSDWLYGPRPVLPEDVTSRDALKAVALVLMVIDHVGLYFVDLELLRAVGRCSMPLWLFLIGYSNSRRLPPILWLGAVAVLAADVGLGYAVWPMRILFTIIVVRLVLAAMGDIFFRSTMNLGAAVALLLIALAPSREILQFGTHALLFAMLGYGLANKKRLGIGLIPLVALVLVTGGSYLMLQVDRFGFDALSIATFAGLLLVVSAAMFAFRPLVILRTRDVFGSSFVRLMGRRTLEIYVIHLIAFKTVYWAWYHAYLSWPFA